MFQADVAIQGDIGEILQDLLQKIGADAAEQSFTRSSGLAMESLDSPGDYAVFQSGFSLVEKFFRELEKHFPEGAVVFDDNIILRRIFRVSVETAIIRMPAYPPGSCDTCRHRCPVPPAESLFCHHW